MKRKQIQPNSKKQPDDNPWWLKHKNNGPISFRLFVFITIMDAAISFEVPYRFLIGPKNKGV